MLKEPQSTIKGIQILPSFYDDDEVRAFLTKQVRTELLLTAKCGDYTFLMHLIASKKSE